MDRKILDIKSVKKKVRGRILLDDITFDLNRGDICGFIGPNGAGKTTLIRIITGLIKPTSGEVKVNYKSVQKNRREALTGMGAIVESPIFFPYLTGRKALKNLAILYSNLTVKDQEEKVEEVLKITGLLEHANKKVGTYSLGMKQRLGIAQALLGNPQCIILDEPANGLDPMGMRFLRDLILRLREEKNLTFLVSSHLLDEIQQICDHLVVIDKGKIIWKGPIKELEGETIWVYTFKNPNQAKKAMTIIEKKHPCKIISGGKVEVDATEEEIEELTKILVNEGMTIRGLEEVTQRLEDTFVEMMKS